VRHIELSLEGSGLQYEPGDALGIRHRNPRAAGGCGAGGDELDGDAAVTATAATPCRCASGWPRAAS
jgi:sulfite reductase (NADPH) flavoprotein alpha-component